MTQIVVSSIRPVRLETGSRQEYLQYILKLVDEAGRRGSDIACLPEDVLSQQAEGDPIGGPIHRAFADRAQAHHMNLIASIIESADGRNYNAAVIFDRRGEIVGRYYKTHLIWQELHKFGLTHGDSLPVFHLDIGPIGILICSDMLHPEAARTLALRGAKVIFFPHQMAEPSEDFWHIMVRARAQDNCAWLVSCSFGVPAGQPYQPQGGSRSWYPNMVIAPDGRIAADGGGNEGMTTAAIDINRSHPLQNYIEYGQVDLWDLIRRYRRPELYEK